MKALFDVWMLILVGISCISTVYLTAFRNNDEISKTQEWTENCILIFFLIDIVLNFFVEFTDPETLLPIRSHKSIAARYLSQIMFYIDVIATLPYHYFSKDGLELFKLLRLFRLHRLLALLDLGKMNKILRLFFEGSKRRDKVMGQYLLIYLYKLFKLILQAILITYFAGCLWYLYVVNIATTEEWDNQVTFIHVFGIS